MGRLVAFGNNASGAILPSVGNGDPPTGILSEPTDITDLVGCDMIHWHTWTSTISSGHKGIRTWGHVHSDFKMLLEGGSQERMFASIGHDEVECLEDEQGFLIDQRQRRSACSWRATAIDGLGKVYGIVGNAIYRYKTLEDAFVGQHEATYTHKLLELGTYQLTALESRCFAHSTAHIFEVEDDNLRLIEAAEGFAFRVVGGRKNRLGLVTDAGDAYLMENREREPELLDLEGEVRFLGIGADFEIAVTQDQVLSRGSNQFGQLGRAGHGADWGEVDLPAKDISGVFCSRWATIFTMR